jgi:hypothetical protein
MKRITVERTQDPAATGYAGCIEGVTDDDRRWIMWLDQHGQPALYWPAREEDGSVIGDAINLQPSESLPG